ncbi:exodeoxyribonuclease V subunit beta [Pseudidiomarina sediminum]|uniref:RecBCD enzyme subunit RecB n=1 Tax=Pseudidiomarina sediminum TaxID=431675 RepID=A0A432Z2G3_9GAMM|nr:exodeoxyribonuclease V subunit beta [Pseudidiomarina sediminum]MBY6064412.1 exodeoxyribonuclease V subunit beta [Pseudidiomarina sediminum]RUO72084.1 exodeoxyribonuclease V subunit beta [Pseudidiomarina sediminum]
MSQPQQLQPLHFPLRNSHLIEASAGTGKTYTIAALYLRLVLGHDPEDAQQQDAGARMKTPREILVVTFTDAATQELRERIRARLTEAAAVFRQEREVKDPFLLQLRAAYAEAQWAEQARVLDLAAQQMDEAAVSTIHGWCNRMLSEHAFASGSLFSQTLNTDTQELWLLAAQDYWRTYIAKLATEQYTHYQVFTEMFASPEALIQRCRGLPASPPNDDDLVVVERYVQALQSLRTTWLDSARWQPAYTDFMDCFVHALPDLKVDGRKLRRNNLENWMQQLQEWLQAVATSPVTAPLTPPFKEAAQRRLTPDGLAEACKFELSEAQLALPRLLEQLYAAVAALPDPQRALLQHAGGWLQQRFRSLQQQRAEIGFDDMLTRLRDALRQDVEGRLASQLRRQFPIAMIDEFQDTDPVQYEIFDRIYQVATTPDDVGVFLIGDPKQAIYSFRNADIYTYLKARAATHGRHHTLATNFRSTQTAVASVNALFTQAEESTRGAFRFKADNGDNAMPFIPVQANGLSSAFTVDGIAQEGLGMLVVEQEKATKAQLDRLLAEQFAEAIAQLLNNPQALLSDSDASKTRKVAPKDIAILVESGAQAQLMRQALRARQLRSVYLSERDSVFAGRMAQELYTVLLACASPRDPRRLRAVLGCDLLGYTLTDIEHIHVDELAWDDFAVRFAGYHELWHHHGVLAMVQQLLHDFQVPARLLQQQSGERELTDLLHLAELLQRQAQHVEGQHGLLRFMAEHMVQAQEENQRANSAELQVRLESDADLIQVVTIHKSKGLQYPLVFLPFISSGREPKVHLPQRYHDANGDSAVAFDANDSDAIARIKEEQFAEEIRKLYVAVTRAQYATYVGVGNYRNLSKSAWYYLFSARDNAKLAATDLVVPEFSFQLASAQLQGTTLYQAPHTAPPQFAARQMPAMHHFEPWWMASYSALRYGEWVAEDSVQVGQVLEARHEQAEVEQAPTQMTLHSFPRGAEPGTFLHNLLEAAAEMPFRALANDAELYHDWLNEQLKHVEDEAQRQILQDWLWRYLQQPFALDEHTPAVTLAELSTYQAEPEFWFPAHHVSAQQLDQWVCRYVLPEAPRPRVLEQQLNGMLKGFIDLVFEWQGKYYVADYKSNYLGADDSAYTQAAMTDKMLASRYDLQLVLYTLALHKLLKARLGDVYDYDTHVGGGLYLFLRGYNAATAGAFYHRPERALIEQLERCFAGEEAPCN